MKVRLDSVRLAEPLDSTERGGGNSAQLAGPNWILTWDTELQVIECIRVNRVKEGDQERIEELWRGETPASGARHWVRSAEQKAAKK